MAIQTQDYLRDKFSGGNLRTSALYTDLIETVGDTIFDSVEEALEKVIGEARQGKTIGIKTLVPGTLENEYYVQTYFWTLDNITDEDLRKGNSLNSLEKTFPNNELIRQSLTLESGSSDTNLQLGTIELISSLKGGRKYTLYTKVKKDTAESSILIYSENKTELLKSFAQEVVNNEVLKVEFSLPEGSIELGSKLEFYLMFNTSGTVLLSNFTLFEDLEVGSSNPINYDPYINQYDSGEDYIKRHVDSPESIKKYWHGTNDEFNSITLDSETMYAVNDPKEKLDSRYTWYGDFEFPQFDIPDKITADGRLWGTVIPNDLELVKLDFRGAYGIAFFFSSERQNLYVKYLELTGINSTTREEFLGTEQQWYATDVDGNQVSLQNYTGDHDFGVLNSNYDSILNNYYRVDENGDYVYSDAPDLDDNGDPIPEINPNYRWYDDCLKPELGNSYYVTLDYDAYDPSGSYNSVDIAEDLNYINPDNLEIINTSNGDSNFILGNSYSIRFYAGKTQKEWVNFRGDISSFGASIAQSENLSSSNFYFSEYSAFYQETFNLVFGTTSEMPLTYVSSTSFVSNNDYIAPNNKIIAIDNENNKVYELISSNGAFYSDYFRYDIGGQHYSGTLDSINSIVEASSYEDLINASNNDAYEIFKITYDLLDYTGDENITVKDLRISLDGYTMYMTADTGQILRIPLRDQFNIGSGLITASFSNNPTAMLTVDSGIWTLVNNGEGIFTYDYTDHYNVGWSGEYGFLQYSFLPDINYVQQTKPQYDLYIGANNVEEGSSNWTETDQSSKFFIKNKRKYYSEPVILKDKVLHNAPSRQFNSNTHYDFSRILTNGKYHIVGLVHDGDNYFFNPDASTIIEASTFEVDENFKNEFAVLLDGDNYFDGSLKNFNAKLIEKYEKLYNLLISTSVPNIAPDGSNSSSNGLEDWTQWGYKTEDGNIEANLYMPQRNWTLSNWTYLFISSLILVKYDDKSTEYIGYSNQGSDYSPITSDTLGRRTVEVDLLTNEEVSGTETFDSRSTDSTSWNYLSNYLSQFINDGNGTGSSFITESETLNLLSSLDAEIKESTSELEEVSTQLESTLDYVIIDGKYKKAKTLNLFGDGTIVPEYEFSGSEYTNIILNEGLVTIEEGAFASCFISTLAIPDSVITIGADAFKDNATLSTATFGIGISSIGSGAFDGTAITEVTLPTSTVIEADTFPAGTVINRI